MPPGHLNHISHMCHQYQTTPIHSNFEHIVFCLDLVSQKKKLKTHNAGCYEFDVFLIVSQNKLFSRHWSCWWSEMQWYLSDVSVISFLYHKHLIYMCQMYEYATNVATIRRHGKCGSIMKRSVFSKVVHSRQPIVWQWIWKCHLDSGDRCFRLQCGKMLVIYGMVQESIHGSRNLKQSASDGSFVFVFNI